MNLFHPALSRNIRSGTTTKPSEISTPSEKPKVEDFNLINPVDIKCPHDDERRDSKGICRLVIKT